MQNIVLAHDIPIAKPFSGSKKMLLWSPLEHLNNLLCSSFNAFQVFCQNPLLVRTSLLCFSEACREEKEHGQIKETTSVK